MKNSITFVAIISSVSANIALMKEAWGEINSPYRSGSLSEGSDQFNIFAKGDTCWIMAAETGKDGLVDFMLDWAKNLDYGREAINSTVSGSRRQHYGCEETKFDLWFIPTDCKAYRWCLDVLRWAYNGFVKAYNDFGASIRLKVQSDCRGSTKYIYTGYSKGAALATVTAFAHMMKGVIQESDNV